MLIARLITLAKATDYIFSAGLVIIIRPETRWSTFGQISK